MNVLIHSLKLTHTLIHAYNEHNHTGTITLCICFKVIWQPLYTQQAAPQLSQPSHST